MSTEWAFLPEVFIYLLAALLVLPLARRLGLGPIIGYLAAGVIIGPWGLALIRNAEAIDRFEHFAALLLLFLAGLSATPLQLRSMLRETATVGLWQIGIGTLLIFLIALLIGLPSHQALVAGLALSLSSGTVARSAFRQRHPGGSELTLAGQRVLLWQTLMLLPLLVLLPLLTLSAGAAVVSPWPLVLKAVLVVIITGVLAWRYLGLALGWVVGTGIDDIFAAVALLVVVGLLLLMRWLNLPAELAALLAGLYLTRSEYGSAITRAIQPFTPLLMGMFFMSTGLGIDFGEFIRRPAETLALVLILVAVKFQILRVMLRRSRVPRQQRLWLATVLSQAGELSLIVLAYAASERILPMDLHAQLVIVVCLSMLSTPLLLRLAGRREQVPALQQDGSGMDDELRTRTQVVLAGQGRMGSLLSRLLREQGIRVVAIDSDPGRYATFRQRRVPGYYGDALRPDLLEAAGIDYAAVLIVAIDDAERAEELVSRARADYPGLSILARARDAAHARRLREAGADRVVAELLESSLMLGECALDLLGVQPLEAQARVEAFRDQEA